MRYAYISRSCLFSIALSVSAGTLLSCRASRAVSQIRADQNNADSVDSADMRLLPKFAFFAMSRSEKSFVATLHFHDRQDVSIPCIQESKETLPPDFSPGTVVVATYLSCDNSEFGAKVRLLDPASQAKKSEVRIDYKLVPIPYASCGGDFFAADDKKYCNEAYVLIEPPSTSSVRHLTLLAMRLPEDNQVDAYLCAVGSDLESTGQIHENITHYAYRNYSHNHPMGSPALSTHNPQCLRVRRLLFTAPDVTYQLSISFADQRNVASYRFGLVNCYQDRLDECELREDTSPPRR